MGFLVQMSGTEQDMHRHKIGSHSPRGYAAQLFRVKSHQLQNDRPRRGWRYAMRILAPDAGHCRYA